MKLNEEPSSVAFFSEFINAVKDVIGRWNTVIKMFYDDGIFKYKNNLNFNEVKITMNTKKPYYSYYKNGKEVAFNQTANFVTDKFTSEIESVTGVKVDFEPYSSAEEVKEKLNSMSTQYNNETATHIWKIYRRREAELLHSSLPEEVMELLSVNLPLDEIEKIYSLVPHLRVVSEGLVSFYSNDKDCVAGRVTNMKLGRFLHKVLPHIDNELVKNVAALFQSVTNLELHTSTDPDAFANVYMSCRNTGSCMDDDERKFRSCFVGGKFYHPSRVYAKPNNGICILYVIDSHGTIIGRCLGNTMTKQHTRVYFDRKVKNSEAKFRRLLRNNGWSRNDKCLVGKPIELVKSDDGCIISPYIDPFNMGVIINNNYLEIGGHCTADESSGLLNDQPPCQ